MLMVGQAESKYWTAYRKLLRFVKDHGGMSPGRMFDLQTWPHMLSTAHANANYLSSFLLTLPKQFSSENFYGFCTSLKTRVYQLVRCVLSVGWLATPLSGWSVYVNLFWELCPPTRKDLMDAWKIRGWKINLDLVNCELNFTGFLFKVQGSKLAIRNYKFMCYVTRFSFFFCY